MRVTLCAVFLSVAVGLSFPFFSPLQSAAAQQTMMVVSGRVVDGETLRPLAAAQVSIPESGLGGLTDGVGRFVLQNVPAGSRTISVQLLGFRAVEQVITGQGGETVVVNFELQEEALNLDAIVVTGTPGGTQRRAIGNVVDRVEYAAVAERTSAIDFQQALGSRVPGLMSMAAPGDAGGGTQIRLRGNSSLSLAGDPLIYVDGVRINSEREFVGRSTGYSRLQDINPADIESIEVIKGPAAATLYGTEASNGVIQIITKRGVAGETLFEASSELGYQWMPDPEAKFSTACRRDRTTLEITCHNFYALMQEPDRFGKPIYQYGGVQRYNLSARGGTDLVRYVASVNRSDVDGIYRLDRDRRNGARVTLTIVPDSRLTINLNGALTGQETNVAGGFMFGLAGTHMADLYYQPGFMDDEWYQARLKASSDIIFGTRSTWGAEMSFVPTEWLTTRLVLGLDDQVLRREQFTQLRPEWTVYTNAASEGSRSVEYVSSTAGSVDLATTARYSMTPSYGGATSVGLQFYDRVRRSNSASGTRFAVSSLSTVTAAALRESGEDYGSNATVGVYVQQELSMLDRLFLTAAVRMDDNSAFGSEYNAAVYPKVSASWVVSDEPFWDSDLIGQFRLRGAWGKAGQQPDAFAAQRLYSPQTGPFGLPMVTPLAVGNPELGPEKGSELEVGFEMGLFDDRASLDFTWYNRTTQDAIVSEPLRPSEGFPGVRLRNVGEIKSWGTETALDLQLLTEDPFRWNLAVAFTTLGNEIVDLGGGRSRIPVSHQGNVDARGQSHVQGFPLAGLFDYKVVSAEFVSGNSGAVTNILCDGGTGRGGVEQGGAAVPCSEAPQVFFGKVEPSWHSNITSTVTLFRNWSVTAVGVLRYGQHCNHDYIASQNTRSSRPFIYQDDAIFMAYNNITRSPPAMFPCGFTRLSELSLRYDLHAGLLERLGASRASIVIAAQNVALLHSQTTVTKYGQKVWDPEMNAPYNDFGGVPMGVSPPLAHATLRLSVTF